MKVAYIGNFGPEYSTENDVRKAFENIGWEVKKLQENEVTPDEIREAAFSSDLLLITTTWDDANPLEEMISIFRECAMKKIPTATIHLDIFWGPSRGGRRWWLSPMFFTKYVFTADGDHQQEWKRMGINHFWLRPGVRHDAIEDGTPRKEYACDVAFVGSNGVGYHEDVWNYRKELVDYLREMCKRNGWRFRNPGGDDPKIERGMDMNDFYASAKVTVGDSLCLNGHRTQYCSDRVYEATGRGGFLIMPELDFLNEDFGGALPMYNWGMFQQLEEMVRNYVNNPVERDFVRERISAITSLKHTYVHRVSEMIERMKFEGEFGW